MHYSLRGAYCRLAFILPAALATLVFGCELAHAADATTIDPGNTAWVLAASVCAVVSLIWVLFGYSFAFDGTGALIGGLGKCFLADVAHCIHPRRIPEYAFVLFQPRRGKAVALTGTVCFPTKRQG
jgi:hypothetical protein